MGEIEVIMTWLIHTAVQLVQALERVSTNKWRFLAVAALVFGVSVGVLAKLDLLPETVPAVQAVSTPVQAVVPESAHVVTPVLSELPTEIQIPAIRLLALVSNPTSTDIAILDKALLKGAVRYPTSAKLGDVGNVVLFGHSSYLPVVNNQAYKAFNNIQKLTVGDIVIVSSAGTAYMYRVRTVAKESTLDAAIVLSVTSRVLTLSTCDSFGESTDRFVVTADFVESHPISASA